MLTKYCVNAKAVQSNFHHMSNLNFNVKFWQLMSNISQVTYFWPNIKENSSIRSTKLITCQNQVGPKLSVTTKIDSKIWHTSSYRLIQVSKSTLKLTNVLGGYQFYQSNLSLEWCYHLKNFIRICLVNAVIITFMLIWAVVIVILKAILSFMRRRWLLEEKGGRP